jgi:hypothetical protein
LFFFVPILDLRSDRDVGTIVDPADVPESAKKPEGEEGTKKKKAGGKKKEDEDEEAEEEAEVGFFSPALRFEDPMYASSTNRNLRGEQRKRNLPRKMSRRKMKKTKKKKRRK